MPQSHIRKEYPHPACRTQKYFARHYSRTQPLDPQTREATHCLQWACRELVQINGYLTSPGASGFGQDWDDHDVIVVQATGTKTWSFREGRREYPLYRDIEFEREGPEGEPSRKLRLAAGDVLYVARGVRHVAEAEHTPSRHVSFGVGRHTPLDSLTFVTNRLRSEVFFRRDIERTNPKSAHETVTRFASTAQDPDFEDFLLARNENSTARKFAQFSWATETKNLVCVAGRISLYQVKSRHAGPASCTSRPVTTPPSLTQTSAFVLKRPQPK